MVVQTGGQCNLARLRIGLHLGQQRGLLHQMCDADVLSAYACRALGVNPHIYVQESAVVGADSAFYKRGHLKRQLIHLLQCQARNIDICGHSSRVLAVGHSAHFLCDGQRYPS